MANAPWPLSLPKGLPLNVRQKPIDPRIQSGVDVGVPRRRLRFTGRHNIYENIVMNLLEHQAVVLDNFIHITLNGGIDPFDWDEPWPGASLKTFKFLELPSPVVLVGGLASRVQAFSFSLEEPPF